MFTGFCVLQKLTVFCLPSHHNRQILCVCAAYILCVQSSARVQPACWNYYSSKFGQLVSDFTKFSVLASTYSSSGISATNFWHFTLMWWCCRWFMPVNILLTFIIGSVLAWILIKITRTPPHLQGLVIGCCSAGNLGNLLLIIVPAVCNESNSPFGDSTVCSSYGMAYASLSMAVRFYLHYVTK